MSMPGDVLDRLATFVKACAKEQDPKACERDLREEAIGELARRDGAWVPLCAEYPNLKGVTCERIEQFLVDHEKPKLPGSIRVVRDDDLTYYDTYNILDDIVTLTPPRLPDDEKRRGLEQYLLQTTGSLGRTASGFVRVRNREEEQAFLKQLGWKEGEDILSFAKDLQRSNAPRETHLEDRAMADDYLQSVKVYDRAEAFEAMERLGRQIREAQGSREGTPVVPDGIFLTTPRGGYEVLSIAAYAMGLGKDQLPADLSPAIPRGEVDPEVHADKKAQEILNEIRRTANAYGLDTDAISLTDLDKAVFLPGQPPQVKAEQELKGTALIAKVLKDELAKNVRLERSRTILGSSQSIYSDTPIYIVDDIVASGDQSLNAYQFLRARFPTNPIHLVVLAKRQAPEAFSSEYFWNTRVQDHLGENVPFGEVLDEAFYDTATVGIEQWKELRKQPGYKPGKYVPTAGFAWSIPDGTSDRGLLRLYGQRVQRGRVRADKDGEGEVGFDYKKDVAEPPEPEIPQEFE